jgi:translocation and assembly module TamA
MVLRLLCTMLVCMALWTSAAQGQEDAPPRSEPTVRYRVQIDGPRQLTSLLQEGLSIVRWQQDPDMTETQLERLVEEAVRQAREAAATEGYFSAGVVGSIDKGEDRWTVHIAIEPGPRTYIADVDLRFTGPAADDDAAKEVLRKIRRGWALTRGQPFRQSAWDDAKEVAQRELSAWKYAGANIANSQALVDPKRQTANLMVELASGPEYRFGLVEVSGARRYPDTIVHKLSPLGQGELFSREKLLIYQRRLLETGYYVSAQVDAEPDPAFAGAMPVRVAVIEGNSQHVEVGIGYNTDRGARFEVRYSDVDLLNSAWRFRSALQLDRKVQNLQLDLDSPPRSNGSWNNFFARTRQQDIQNESTSELAVGVQHQWGFERTPNAFIVSAHTEEQIVGGTPREDRHAIYIGYRHPFRKTDDPVSPRSGYLGSIEVGGAPDWLSSRVFTRAVGSLTLLVPLGRRDDLLLRSQLGIVLSGGRDGIPSSFLFRTGGDQTVRGYGFESIGVPEGDAIVGGRYLAVGSVEYTHWFSDSWGLAAFMDAGNAWDDRDRLRLARGYGVGGRFRTPIGPIRADLAYGERSQDIRLHFSVGFTF